MANFIFNWADAALAATTLDLSTGTYYAHLVVSAPSISSTTVANLALVSVSGYAPVILTGLSQNTTRWTFDSFNFPKYLFATSPTGVVICQRAGASPASTDQVICYSDLSNTLGQPIILQVGTYIVNLVFGPNGAINYSYRYLYSSGAYNASAGAFPPGLIYLIGTKNNTQTYVNPFTVITSPNGIDLFNRAVTNIGTQRIALDFGVNRIRVGAFGVNYTSPGGTTPTEVWGTNSLATFTNTDIDNNTQWTSLGTSPSHVMGWNFFNVTNLTFFRYLKWTRPSSGINNVSEIEFYNSAALSPTVSFT